MAYLLRSLAVIGVIALNSPVHGGKSSDGSAIETARGAVKAAAQIDARGAMQSLTAAREAAQIMAGLDPETRQRVLSLALPGGSARAQAPERDGKGSTR